MINPQLYIAAPDLKAIWETPESIYRHYWRKRLRKHSQNMTAAPWQYSTVQPATAWNNFDQ